MAKHYLEQVVGRSIAGAQTGIMGLRSTVAGDLEKVTVYTKGNVSSTQTFDVNHGTHAGDLATVFPTAGDRPSITSGNHSDEATPTDPVTVAVGDLLTVDADVVNESFELATVVFEIEDGVSGGSSYDGGRPANATLNTHYFSEDFIGGGYGSGAAFAHFVFNGTANLINGEAHHPGIIRMSSSSSAGSWIAGYPITSSSLYSLLASDNWEINFIARPSNVASGQAMYRLGLSTVLGSSGVTPTDGIYIERASTDASWFGVCRAGGTQTRSALTGGLANNTWFRIRIRRVDASTIGFSINGGSEVTINTNVPNSAALYPIAAVWLLSSGTMTLDVDFYDISISDLVRY